eukprot:Blabericola_migrator_1__9995@NODE_5531_length_739_cov_170_952381_g3588_i0_p1_GENE_NODE_5531_length_739_cov_170_952381_g3588_i0NODE_5531_length_739_cov_170_952381_g3588_i0_p1_ORF_typecomplete_len136_score12_69TMEM171/PF15471_6/0_0031PIRT/PF15099_6/0_015LPG_synthase_TM/PF03706_13/0_045KCH/PF16944_5/0_087Wzy_C_2/PF11846_8/0_08DUF5453/PF17534_2/0_12Cad/PF03596_13/0_13Baculo_11_kDa/PF06143_11/0_78Baculo_11_kDa/PF06143_11/3e02Phage_holin_3_6/PF07332_11/0_34SLC3A2_N/PF16028_5/3_1e02SLC3A2_N/PF16028_5/2
MGLCSKLCWSYCCILYFIFAVLFLTVLGILCAQDSHLSEVKMEIRTKAAGPVFIALGIYAVCALVSVVYLVLHNRKAKKNPPTTAFESNRQRKGKLADAALLGTTSPERPSPSRSMAHDGDATYPQRGQSLLNDD